MRRMRRTTAVLILGGLGGLLSGVLVSVASAVIGPDAMHPGDPNASDILLLACLQGAYVGTPVGLLLGPLAHFGMGRGVSPLRLAFLTGLATVGFGIAFAAVGGAPAGLAGGVVGFYVAASLASAARRSSGSTSDVLTT